jgi:hypothetical protein
LPGANTLAYYENPSITDVKRFYNIGPRSVISFLCCLIVAAQSKDEGETALFEEEREIKNDVNLTKQDDGRDGKGILNRKF